MKKNIICLALAAFMVFSLSGCAGLFSKEYLSVTDYTDNDSDKNGDEAITVSDFSELKSAVGDMVAAYLPEGKLIFSNYTGDLQSDLSQVGWSLKSEDALANYCVDYVSYDLNRIVTYYEAQIHITYKKTAEDVAAIKPVAGLTGFKKQLSAGLNDCVSKLTVQWYSRELTQETVAAAIQEVYLSDPASCGVAPTPFITVHNSATSKNIVEISFKYGFSEDQLLSMKEELDRKIDSIVSAAGIVGDSQSVRKLLDAVAAACEYDNESVAESAVSALSLSSTAYGALVVGKGDDLGMALAFQAVCKAAGIECSVVSGTLNHAVHYWNTIKTDGANSHVDAASLKFSSSSPIFMLSDAQMSSRGYAWK